MEREYAIRGGDVPGSVMDTARGDGPTWHWPSTRGASADDEVVAPVLGARVVVQPRILRPLGAVADGGDPLRGDAEADQVVLRGARPVLAQRQVVLGRSKRIAVSLDTHLRLVAGPHSIGHPLQRGSSFVAQLGGVEVEEDRLVVAGR